MEETPGTPLASPPPALPSTMRRRHRRSRPKPTEHSSASHGAGLRGGGFAFDGEALRRVREAGKRAALAGKRKIWDTNDASLHVAQSAVDSWESTYLALRSLLITSARSAASTYGAVKSAASGIENHLFVPVRDTLLLPAFAGAERAAAEAAGFVQSDDARRLACGTLDLVRKMPFVGETVLAPALCMGADAMVTAWAVAQYPIPSRNAVRTTVDGALTVTKLALRNTAREIFYYMNIVDATITRTMLHTQWRILGSGPYSSLSPNHQHEILDHICERYFALSESHPIARYEFAAHIMAKNKALYDDLVHSGLLLCRAQENDRTKGDDWLSPELPSYWMREAPLLLHGFDGPEGFPFKEKDEAGVAVLPLWFRLPYVNGKRPGKDSPWIRFSPEDEEKLEQAFKTYARLTEPHDEAYAIKDVDASDMSDFDDAKEEEESLESCHAVGSDRVCPDYVSTPEILPPFGSIDQQYPTVAKWYEPDLSKDVLIDQSRHAVSFKRCCGLCRSQRELMVRPGKDRKDFGQNLTFICSDCYSSRGRLSHSSLLPWTQIVMRPTLWRFHGNHSNDVRRATWLLDTKRHGLQPYGEESAAVLEDAYMFLKYYCLSGSNEKDTSIANSPLSVEVRGPDGEEQQLVQFQSLTSVTATQKTLGGAVAVFKRRVYRGALSKKTLNSKEELEFSAGANTMLNDEEDILAARDLSNQGSKKDMNSVDKTTCSGMSSGNPCLSIAVPNMSQASKESNHGVAGDNIEHLVLVVHGIGEMLRSVDLFGMGLPALCSIVDCCGWLRENHSAVRAAQFSGFEKINKSSSFTQEEMASAIMGRTEYLPVEWHEAFSLHTQRRVHQSVRGQAATTLTDISLKTIPALREFANDTLLDVLYFMSPTHHDIIVDIVVRELHEVVRRYKELTGFSGKISILAHSLGSVISWDILSHQMTDLCGQFGDHHDQMLPSPHLCSPWFEESAPERSGMPYPQLRFKVHNFFMVGSPVAVFLMIRDQREPLKEDFSLPGCPRVYNIFHPYDPAAYRIEPLINAQNATVDAKIISHWKGGLRVKYQTKYILKRLVDETRRTQKTVADAVEAGIAGMGLLDDDFMEEENDELSSVVSNESGIDFVDCGSLNQGRRVDFMLQEKEIENANEYVFALAAHSSYWVEKDLSSFLARQIFRSKLDEDMSANDY